MTEQIAAAAHLMQLLRRLRQIGPERQPPFETVGITSAQLALGVVVGTPSQSHRWACLAIRLDQDGDRFVGARATASAGEGAMAICQPDVRRTDNVVDIVGTRARDGREIFVIYPIIGGNVCISSML